MQRTKQLAKFCYSICSEYIKVSCNEPNSFLNFGKEPRTINDITNDIRSIIYNDNSIPEMTPNLKRFEKFSTQIRENIEKQQDKRKEYDDQHRNPVPEFNLGDRLLYCSFHQ
ncbi:hypothetical protein CEXT_663211 [Caerostris extrusa]|uniref:Uncharacterized protein n=1 Tax=Caerostris extrusa TaxID=172846 RepID=A0AAV4QXL4_CAEEX|nr:hypothetical protein CEXT_663211 [Caerostris extrusa]